MTAPSISAMPVLYVLLDGTEPETCSFDRHELERLHRKWSEADPMATLRIVPYLPKAWVAAQLRQVDRRLAAADRELDGYDARFTPRLATPTHAPEIPDP